VGVDEAQPPQTPPTGPRAPQIGQKQLLMVADDDVRHDAAAINQNTNLALHRR
jgi:hypothetical protein